MSCSRLWIGGTSGLARTYLNAYPEEDEWILLGHDDMAPHWMAATCRHYYAQYDLTTNTKTTVSVSLLEKLQHVQQVVISIRPPLVSSLDNDKMHAYCERMVRGLDVLLQTLVSTTKIQTIVHISSVAAVNHLQAQSMHGIDMDTVLNITELDAPYDRFKRACEQVVERIATSSHIVAVTSLRLSAIFSDDPGCIQCNALAIQSRVGAYLPHAIDCNSSRNVAAAIRLVLHKTSVTLQPCYYYTRPSHHVQPVPYGHYLVEYRNAYNMTWCCIWIPVWVVQWIVAFVHWISRNYNVPYLHSIDYLLQVSHREHSFDNAEFLRDFPEIAQHEETIEQCFRRRRRILASSNGT